MVSDAREQHGILDEGIEFLESTLVLCRRHLHGGKGNNKSLCQCLEPLWKPIVLDISQKIVTLIISTLNSFKSLKCWL